MILFRIGRIRGVAVVILYKLYLYGRAHYEMSKEVKQLMPLNAYYMEVSINFLTII
jgi:hypothetical protein